MPIAKRNLTGRLGGRGDVQSLAAVVVGNCCPAVECNSRSIDFRLRTKGVEEKAETLDKVLVMMRPGRPRARLGQLAFWMTAPIHFPNSCAG